MILSQLSSPYTCKTLSSDLLLSHCYLAMSKSKLLEQRETELPKKLVATMVPLAKEVKKLKEEVGIQ